MRQARPLQNHRGENQNYRESVLCNLEVSVNFWTESIAKLNS